MIKTVGDKEQHIRETNDHEIENNKNEEENLNDEENEDVQSFVTAVDNENDLAESINDLHLGHDDDGTKLNIH